MRVTLLLAITLISGCTCDQPKAVGKPKGGDCVKAADCSGALVCNPDTKTCDHVTCTTNTECGAGAACSNNACIPNVAGGACDADLNCINGEQCRGDTCHPQGSEGSACTTTEGCTLPLVCNPADGTCATTVACTGNVDCGTAAFCDGTNCVPAGNQTPCTADANCSSGEHCLGVVCVPDGCQGEAFQAEVIPPNMLIVFDRSGSMNDDLGNDGPKIDVAKAAVTALVNAHAGPASLGGPIRFGFAPFPSAQQVCSQDEQCAAGFIAVDVADNNAQPIIDFMAGMNTCRGTPTGDQIAVVEQYAPLKDTTRSNFVVLITDGAANCGVDTPPEIANLLAATPSVKTFVIGFGSGVDASQLTDMSAAGGEALPGDPNYFQADNAASLDQIFTTIAQAVLSCDYTLQGAGDDPNALLVFFNGQPVPRDATHVSGWDYTPATSTLSFTGNACIALQSGSVNDLSIAFGCPVAGEGEGEGAGEGEGEGAGEGEGEGQACGGNGGTCNADADCCPGFICNTANHSCLFLGG